MWVTFAYAKEAHAVGGRYVVLRHALAVGVHDPEIVLSFG
jgi:hypothetical protein